jgi:hypothetical protein
MAGVAQEHIQQGRDLLAVARQEYRNAQLQIGDAAVTAPRNFCGKGWLAVLEAAYAFFLKQGVSVGELPGTDRGRWYFAQRYMDREMRNAFHPLRSTFHIDGYYEGIVEFVDMPQYFQELQDFIDPVDAAPQRAIQLEQ